ncbi:MAG: M56 family metallopeptidase [Actinomycetota bacterium]|nr:M56 family metallopeptidase [Actinomycetota bacterium]
MAFVILLSGGAFLVLPGLVLRPGRRMAPARWAWLCVVSLVVGATMVQLTTLLLAAPTVLHALGIPALASACQRLLGSLVPGGALVGWAAAAASVTMPVLAGRGLAAARRTRRDVEVEAHHGDHRTWNDHDVVLLPTDEVLAVSVGGRHRQIIVSRGLVAALSDAEVEAVLRHEAAHQEQRHQRFLLLATALERGLPFLPLLRRSTATLRLALERWADEEAAGVDPEARRVLHSALLGVTWAVVNPSLAAFSAAETLIERLRALELAPLQSSPIPRAVLLAPGLALGLLSLSALSIWIGDARVLLAMAGRCPI